MNTHQIGTKVRGSFKSGFFKGVGIGAGLLVTGLFAAAGTLDLFNPNEVLSADKMNLKFQKAAPQGAIMAFYLAGPGNTPGCPEGWAPADGTDGTPDLRGRFIRGRDDVGTAAGAAGRDPDGARAEGNEQDDRFQGHYHQNGYNNTKPYASGGINGDFLATGGITNDTGGVQQPTNDGTNGAPRIANETRPENVALTYCMRKDI